jgi:hypothetical protein
MSGLGEIVLYQGAVLTILGDLDPDNTVGISCSNLIVEIICHHFAALMVETQSAITIQILEPSFELDELDVPVIMEHIDPHPEMKNVTVGSSKKRYIIFISGGQCRICVSGWISMDALFAEGDPDLAIRMLADPTLLF